jgi:peptidoglycan endopeptidase LytF
MSRRDTIIIAVLVNAALLMILFATAIRSDHSKENSKKNSHIQLAETSATKPVESSASIDLLNEFVTTMPTLVESGQNVLSFEETEIAMAAPEIEVTQAPPTLSPVRVEETKPIKPKTEEHFASVTVKKGDFLEKIAKANNTTVAAIMQANHLSSTQLKVGQVLKIPLGESKKNSSKSVHSSSSSPSSSEGEYYVVKEGDSPWLIASRNKIKLEDLLRLNGLDEQKAKRLRPGDKLKIR